jgi:N-acetylglutamate synthase-like GNAT family acetyltransferase
MNDSVEFRIAQLADAKEITNIINSAFREAEGFFIETDRIHLEEVQELLRSGTFLFAENKHSTMGCVYVEPRGNRSYLGLLSVAPDRRQSGLGSMLLAAAEDHCRQLGCRFMDIKIVNLRKDLPDFYRKRGYLETGTSPFPTDVETKLPCHFIDMTKLLVNES